MNLKEELKLRKIIRFGIQKVLAEQYLKQDKEKLEEQKLREIIRKMILKEREARPAGMGNHEYTAINKLDLLLRDIIPQLEEDYKTLTTSQDQRKSFRAHIVTATKNLLEPEKLSDSADEESSQEEQGVLSSPDQELKEAALRFLAEEALNITVDDETPGDEEKFIDIYGDDKEAEEEVDPDVAAVEKETEPEKREEFGLEGYDETGRNEAYDSFKAVKKQILGAYVNLADPKDKEMFYDYLITNLKLYFDRWEEELSITPEEPTTDEYEQEKQNDMNTDEGGEEELDLGDMEL